MTRKSAATSSATSRTTLPGFCISRFCENAVAVEVSSVTSWPSSCERSRTRCVNSRWSCATDSASTVPLSMSRRSRSSSTNRRWRPASYRSAMAVAYSAACSDRSLPSTGTSTRSMSITTDCGRPGQKATPSLVAGVAVRWAGFLTVGRPTVGMFDTVVIATDGSGSAQRAVEAALDLAGKFDATVHALYVVDEGEVESTPDDVRDVLERALATTGGRALSFVREAATSDGET